MASETASDRAASSRLRSKSFAAVLQDSPLNEDLTVEEYTRSVAHVFFAPKASLLAEDRETAGIKGAKKKLKATAKLTGLFAGPSALFKKQSPDPPPSSAVVAEASEASIASNDAGHGLTQAPERQAERPRAAGNGPRTSTVTSATGVAPQSEGLRPERSIAAGRPSQHAAQVPGLHGIKPAAAASVPGEVVSEESSADALGSAEVEKIKIGSPEWKALSPARRWMVVTCVVNQTVQQQSQARTERAKKAHFENAAVLMGLWRSFGCISKPVVPFLDQLPQYAVRRMLADASVRFYRASEPIYTSAEAADGLLLVLSGRVELRSHKRSMSELQHSLEAHAWSVHNVTDHMSPRHLKSLDLEYGHRFMTCWPSMVLNPNMAYTSFIQTCRTRGADKDAVTAASLSAEHSSASASHEASAGPAAKTAASLRFRRAAEVLASNFAAHGAGLHAVAVQAVNRDAHSAIAVDVSQVLHIPQASFDAAMEMVISSNLHPNCTMGKRIRAPFLPLCQALIDAPEDRGIFANGLAAQMTYFHPWMMQFTETQRTVLLSTARLRLYREGQVICIQGRTVTTVNLVLNGVVECFHCDGDLSDAFDDGDLATDRSEAVLKSASEQDIAAQRVIVVQNRSKLGKLVCLRHAGSVVGGGDYTDETISEFTCVTSGIVACIAFKQSVIHKLHAENGKIAAGPRERQLTTETTRTLRSALICGGRHVGLWQFLKASLSSILVAQPKEVAVAFVKHGRYCKLPARRSVYTIGEPCKSFYLILTGSVGLFDQDSCPEVDADGHMKGHADALTAAATPDAPGEAVPPGAEGILGDTTSASAGNASCETTDRSVERSKTVRHRTAANATATASMSARSSLSEHADVRLLHPGERFGDAELITSNLKRITAAFAMEPTELLILPRTQYYTHRVAITTEKEQEVSYLHAMPTLASWPLSSRIHVDNLFSRVRLPPDHVLSYSKKHVLIVLQGTITLMVDLYGGSAQAKQQRREEAEWRSRLYNEHYPSKPPPAHALQRRTVKVLAQGAYFVVGQKEEDKPYYVTSPGVQVAVCGYKKFQHALHTFGELAASPAAFRRAENIIQARSDHECTGGTQQIREVLSAFHEATVKTATDGTAHASMRDTDSGTLSVVVLSRMRARQERARSLLWQLARRATIVPPDAAPVRLAQSQKAHSLHGTATVSRRAASTPPAPSSPENNGVAEAGSSVDAVRTGARDVHQYEGSAVSHTAARRVSRTHERSGDQSRSKPSRTPAGVSLGSWPAALQGSASSKPKSSPSAVIRAASASVSLERASSGREASTDVPTLRDRSNAIASGIDPSTSHLLRGRHDGTASELTRDRSCEDECETPKEDTRTHDRSQSADERGRRDDAHSQHNADAPAQERCAPVVCACGKPYDVLDAIMMRMPMDRAQSADAARSRRRQHRVCAARNGMRAGAVGPDQRLSIRDFLKADRGCTSSCPSGEGSLEIRSSRDSESSCSAWDTDGNSPRQSSDKLVKRVARGYPPPMTTITQLPASRSAVHDQMLQRRKTARKKLAAAGVHADSVVEVGADTMRDYTVEMEQQRLWAKICHSTAQFPARFAGPQVLKQNVDESEYPLTENRSFEPSHTLFFDKYDGMDTTSRSWRPHTSRV